MEIHFRTKEESNLLQEKEFLKLTGAERISRFIEMSTKMMNMPSAKPYKVNPNNFILEKKKKK